MTIYRGNCLRVDLTDHKINKETTPDNGIGARTWNSVTLLEELKPGIDPLGPENILCIAVGPLTGSELIATCRFIASAKSPLTGYLGDSGAAVSSLPSCAGRALTRSFSPVFPTAGFICRSTTTRSRSGMPRILQDSTSPRQPLELQRELQ